MKALCAVESRVIRLCHAAAAADCKRTSLRVLLLARSCLRNKPSPAHMIGYWTGQKGLFWRSSHIEQQFMAFRSWHRVGYVMLLGSIQFVDCILLAGSVQLLTVHSRTV